MKSFVSLVAAVLVVSCAGPPKPLVVKTFVLRDQVRETGDEPMIRMEKERRLRGAVSMEERRQRLGQYYTLLWHDPADANGGEVEVLFQFRQGATGSRVKRMNKVFPASASEGIAEFAVIGDDYFDGGRVLAWQATVTRGGREIAVRRSYLWR